MKIDFDDANLLATEQKEHKYVSYNILIQENFNQIMKFKEDAIDRGETLFYTIEMLEQMGGLYRAKIFQMHWMSERVLVSLGFDTIVIEHIYSEIHKKWQYKVLYAVGDKEFCKVLGSSTEENILERLENAKTHIEKCIIVQSAMHASRLLNQKE